MGIDEWRDDMGLSSVGINAELLARSAAKTILDGSAAVGGDLVAFARLPSESA